MSIMVKQLKEILKALDSLPDDMSIELNDGNRLAGAFINAPKSITDALESAPETPKGRDKRLDLNVQLAIYTQWRKDEDERATWPMWPCYSCAHHGEGCGFGGSYDTCHKGMYDKGFPKKNVCPAHEDKK